MTLTTTLVKSLARGIPYLPAPLQSLPYALSLHATSRPASATLPFSYSEFYKHAQDPAHTIVPLFLGSMVGAYVVGVVTQNVSQIDRLWTLLPTLYTAHFALYPLWNANGAAYQHNVPRLFLMLALQMLWTTRLTYNTFRRGFFKSFAEEDYRWDIWRKLVPGWLFALFHISFIAIIQSVLLVMIALPAHNILVTPPAEVSLAPLGTSLPFGLTFADVILASLALLTLYTQWTADNQQYSFQSYKYALQDVSKGKVEAQRALERHRAWRMEGGLARIEWTQADADQGFTRRGLWAWSRHPNFACEQTFWLIQGMFALVNTRPSGITKRAYVMAHPLYGALALSFLFLSSTAFTEWITARKYPAYASYQHLVGEFLPQETIARGIIARLIGKRRKWATDIWGSTGRPIGAVANGVGKKQVANGKATNGEVNGKKK